MKLLTIVIALALMGLAMASSTSYSEVHISGEGGLWVDSDTAGTLSQAGGQGSAKYDSVVSLDGTNEYRDTAFSLTAAPGFEKLSIYRSRAKDADGPSRSSVWYSRGSQISASSLINLTDSNLTHSSELLGEGNLWYNSQVFGTSWKPDASTNILKTEEINASIYDLIVWKKTNATAEDWLPCTNCMADSTPSYKAETSVYAGPLGAYVGKNVSSYWIVPATYNSWNGTK
jgi:hypothetical protein